MRQVFLPLLLGTLAAAAAAESPADYAARLGLEVPADSSLLRLTLDADVYRATRRADLGDLRVFNAAGEALPMARLPRERAERRFVARLALTPLPAAPGDGAGATRVVVEERGGDTRVRVDVDHKASAMPAPTRFVADTASFPHPVHAIEIPLAADGDFEGRLLVETSRDLATWRSLATNEAVLAVGKGEARIERTQITLAGRAERYLRLSWLGAPPVPAPAGIELIHHEQPNPPQRQWLELSGNAAGVHVDYLAPGLFPVDQFRLVPAAGNDVVAARVASRPGVSARWQFRARSVGYRLQGEGAVREGSPVSLALTRDPLWRVSAERPQTAGAPALLQLGWVPEEIVFVARGAGPYLLAVGHPDRAPAWLSPQTIVPGYGTGAEAAMAVARIAGGDTPVAAAARPSSLWQPGRHWWLWGALGLGVAVLGWMARGVWRELGGRRKA